MLGFAEGKIISKSFETSQMVLLVGGVGYEITLSKQTLEKLEVNQEISVWLHTHVREDIFTLFGFLNESEKQLFRILIGVSGLGPKTALSLLSEHGAEKLIQLIIQKRTSEISEASGVGKKLAERISLELSGKLEKLAWIQLMPSNAKDASTPVLSKESQLKMDLNSALTHLGYQPTQVKNLLDKLFMDETTAQSNFETLLRKSLSEISGRSLNTKEASVV